MKSAEQVLKEALGDQNVLTIDVNDVEVDRLTELIYAFLIDVQHLVNTCVNQRQRVEWHNNIQLVKKALFELSEKARVNRGVNQ